MRCFTNWIRTSSDDKESLLPGLPAHGRALTVLVITEPFVQGGFSQLQLPEEANWCRVDGQVSNETKLDGQELAGSIAL